MFDIAKYEAMAMLDLPDDERGALGKRAAALAESFAALDEIDAGGVLPLVSVLDIHTVLRQDVSEKILTRDEIMANAPEQRDGYFQVPGTLE